MTTPHTHRRPPMAAIIVAPLVAALVFVLSAWPTARLEPHDLPVGVAGAPAAVQGIEKHLLAADAAFDVRRLVVQG